MNWLPYYYQQDNNQLSLDKIGYIQGLLRERDQKGQDDSLSYMIEGPPFDLAAIPCQEVMTYYQENKEV